MSIVAHRVLPDLNAELFKGSEADLKRRAQRLEAAFQVADGPIVIALDGPRWPLRLRQKSFSAALDRGFEIPKCGR